MIKPKYLTALFCILALPAYLAAQQPATSPPSNLTSPAATGVEAEYRQLLGQWQGIVSGMAELQTKIQLPSNDREALVKQRADLVAKAYVLLPKLRAAAEKAYAADENNREAGDLLFTMAASDLRQDNPEEALRLAKFLIEHHFPVKDIYGVAASAAFAIMDLDTTQKMLEAQGDGKIPNDAQTQAIVTAIKKYQPMWEREQKLRAAEDKANNLPQVKIQTTKGDIVVELLENEAPNTVANFINLVNKKFYDGVQFHRVLPGFMAQGGDPLSKDPAKNEGKIGNGGPGYTIADECGLPEHRNHFRGSLSMAHTDMPNSGGSQFFMMFAPSEHLDGKYTVFGRIIDGFDVLSKLQRIDPQHPTPVIPDKIIKAEVLRKRDHAYEPKTIAEK